MGTRHKLKLSEASPKLLVHPPGALGKKKPLFTMAETFKFNFLCIKKHRVHLRNQKTRQFSLSCINTLNTFFFLTFALNFGVFIPLGIHTCSSFAGGAGYKVRWKVAPELCGPWHSPGSFSSLILMIFVLCEAAERSINPHLVI